MFNSYIKYIKDNPKGYWFRSKWYGYGWTPAKWQGWAILAIYFLLVFFVFSGVDSSSHSASDKLFGVAVPVIVLTVILILICYLKGEKPHWSWGKPKQK